MISKPTDAPCFKCKAGTDVECGCAPRGIDFQYLSEAAQENYRKAHELCDSPIETMMLEGLQVQSFGEDFEFLIGFTSPQESDFGKAAVLCVPQLEVGPYRADIVLFDLKRSTSEMQYALVIECDGHDFHERTKEQAAYDRSRDRDMQLAGYEVIRFTGHEINRDAYACADHAIAFVKRGIR